MCNKISRKSRQSAARRPSNQPITSLPSSSTPNMLHLLPLLCILAIAKGAPKSSADAETVLFITDSAPVETTGCLARAYHGSYGGKADQHIYLPSSSCLDLDDTWKTFSEGRIAPVPLAFNTKAKDEGRLVWVGQAGVEGMSPNVADDWASIDALSRVVVSQQGNTLNNARQGQKVLGEHGPTVSLVHSSSDSMVLHVPSTVLPLIDTLLPAHLVPVAIPLSPLPLRQDITEDGASTTEWKSVPGHYAKHLAGIVAGLKFDASLDSVLSLIDHDQVRRNVRWLTGEAPSGIVSRHSFTEGAIKAGHWLKGASPLSTAYSLSIHFAYHSSAPSIV